MKALRYIQVGDEGTIPVNNKTFKTACCDCGLVHLWTLRSTKAGGFEFYVERDNRATAQMRKHKGIVFKYRQKEEKP